MNFKKSLICIVLLGLAINAVDAKLKKNKASKDYLNQEVIQGDVEQVQDTCYGIIFDAGSSGTRYVVYKWICREINQLPVVDFTPIKSEKKNIPIAQADTKSLHDLFDPFLDTIKQLIPVEKHPSTVLLLGATAGMRLIPKMQQFKVIDEIRRIFRNSGFHFIDDSKARVITGQEEAIFLWISANTVTGKIKSQTEITNPDTFTTVDIGGASTQIAFVDKVDEDSEGFFQLNLPENNIYTLKAASELLGLDVSRIEIIKSEPRNPENTGYLASCFNNGYQNNDPNVNSQVIGTGNPQECINNIRRLFQISECPFPDVPSCAEKSIFIKGVEGRETMAVSGALYSRLNYNMPETFNAHDLRQAAINFCSRSWSDVKDENSKKAQPIKYQFENVCYAGLYVSTLLIDGYGLGNLQIYAPEKIQGVEPSWSLGYLLFELSNHSCDDLTNSFCLSNKQMFAQLMN